MITAGDLKARLQDVPDDVPVYASLGEEDVFIGMEYAEMVTADVEDGEVVLFVVAPFDLEKTEEDGK